MTVQECILTPLELALRDLQQAWDSCDENAIMTCAERVEATMGDNWRRVDTDIRPCEAVLVAQGRASQGIRILREAINRVPARFSI